MQLISSTTYINNIDNVAEILCGDAPIMIMIILIIMLMILTIT